MKVGSKVLPVALVSLLGMAALPAAAQGATAIGQNNGGGVACPLPGTGLQSASNVGTGYEIPAEGGVITSWTSNMGGVAGSVVVASRTNPPNVFTLTDASEAQSLPGTFPTRLPVEGGQILGIRLNQANASNCAVLAPPGNKIHEKPNGGIVGVPETYNQIGGDGLLNIAAVLEPDADKDEFGDETQDGCVPDSVSTGACAVTIDKKPKKKIRTAKATFAFSIPDADAITECRIDKKAFAPCTSPFKAKKLKVRKHTFRVHALGLDGAPGADQVVKFRRVD